MNPFVVVPLYRCVEKIGFEIDVRDRCVEKIGFEINVRGHCVSNWLGEVFNNNNNNNNNSTFFAAAGGQKRVRPSFLCVHSGMQKRRPTNIKCCGRNVKKLEKALGGGFNNNNKKIVVYLKSGSG